VANGYGPRGDLRAPSELHVRQVFRSRIFIAEEMKVLKVQERWENAVHHRDKRGGTVEEFREQFDELCADLRAAALGIKEL
jgi:hypothetical protein